MIKTTTINPLGGSIAAHAALLVANRAVNRQPAHPDWVLRLARRAALLSGNKRNDAVYRVIALSQYGSLYAPACNQQAVPVKHDAERHAVAVAVGRLSNAEQAAYASVSERQRVGMVAWLKRGLLPVSADAH